jgi:hypothetical protein
LKRSRGLLDAVVRQAKNDRDAAEWLAYVNQRLATLAAAGKK